VIVAQRGGSVTTLAAIFLPRQPPEQVVPVARAAEAAGLDELWVFEDCFSESGIATATAMLAVTGELRVGIGLLPVPLRNVALTAMEVATVARMFPGRLTAGVGHGVQDWMAQVGAKVESPMTLLREYTTALYALLHGQALTQHGRYVHLADVALDWPPREVPPLLVGAVGPRGVALAGELSDGVIIAGGRSLAEVGDLIEHYRNSRSLARPSAGGGQVVAFTSASVETPAADVAAVVNAIGAAGVDCVAISDIEEDGDLERFVTFLAAEVKPLLS
jgi:alkanesulfonate monooxygenase SsuD/methylene tetrahydromethanopterin reductase-like flavin-dependent oxidoreductase (luciferase family)